VPFNQDAYNEDNDSSEEESDDPEHPKIVEVNGEKRQQVTLRNKHGLEFFIT